MFILSPTSVFLTDQVAWAWCRYLGGAFDVETLVENLLDQMAGSQIIAVNVYDITNESMPLVMYGHTNVERSKNTHVSLLDFGDPLRKHEMRCRCFCSVTLVVPSLYPSVPISFHFVDYAIPRRYFSFIYWRNLANVTRTSALVTSDTLTYISDHLSISSPQGSSCRFSEDALPPWTAISTSVGIFVIAFLVGHMLHASRNRIDKVEENCRIFQELKVRADDAVIAKSQVCQPFK